MKTVLVIMTGIGFTLGVVFGLLLQLPIDTLPAGSPLTHDNEQNAIFGSAGRSRRSLDGPGGPQGSVTTNVHHISDKDSQTPWVVVENNERKHFRVRPGSGSKGKVIHSKPSSSSSSSLTSSSSVSKFSSSLSLPSLDSSHTKHASNQNQSLSGNRSSSRETRKSETKEGSVRPESTSREDAAYLASLVDGITWSPQLEASCPRPFPSDEVDAWRRRAASLDVVKVEEGCGRMQNRLLTFRDASRACARYRLNTDQIQGEVFSHYLAHLLNISHVPPTVLAQVDSRAGKWRAVHLPLSLAQWADGRLVVLTRFIDGLNPALIPQEFRGDDADLAHSQSDVNSFKVKGESSLTGLTLPADFNPRLVPTTSGLGGKSRGELCQLLQWSDLIVFDYLTANLDRVINNMFNRQWNDQMMANPAHNLEARDDGALVFLDNESGLFHGYRLLSKYAPFHRALLGALCVFRSSTVSAVRRLRDSRSVGLELREIFAKGEPELHSYLAPLPERNVKVLQQRLDDVVAQIDACEAVFGAAAIPKGDSGASASGKSGARNDDKHRTSDSSSRTVLDESLR